MQPTAIRPHMITGSCVLERAKRLVTGSLPPAAGSLTPRYGTSCV